MEETRQSEESRGVALRLGLALVALGLGVIALLVAILLVRGVLV